MYDLNVGDEHTGLGLDLACPERILIAGDIHGNTAWMIDHVLAQAKRENCKLVIQLGDFGVWPGRAGKTFLDVVNRELSKAGMELWFIDGNHEDFEQLYAVPLDRHGRRPLRGHITHLPRGYRWRWAGRTFLACGGATSIDMAESVPGRTWWPQESVTRADVERCAAGGHADVLFTHDVNAEVDADHRVARQQSWLAPEPVLAAIRRNRGLLQEIVDGTTPLLQVHGHIHAPYDESYLRSIDGEAVRVVSLNCDDHAASLPDKHCAVLDLTDAEIDVRSTFRVID